MRIIALVIALAAALPMAHGTAQYPDNLMLDGQTHLLHSNPLEPYFSRHPDRLPKSRVESSALWRGYVATFEAVGGRLRVRDVEIQEIDEAKKEWETKWVSVLDRAFPPGVSRVLDDFTGFLILPQGKVTNYVHMGYASTFESYRLLFVRAGHVAADRAFTAEEYAEYKVKQFEAFTRTERYRSMQAKLPKGRPGPSAGHFLYIFDASFPVETLIDYKDFRPNQVVP